MQSTQTSKQANGYKIAPVNSTADGLKLLEQLQKTKTESEFLECMKELYCTAVRHEQLDESGFISEKQRAQITGWLKNSDEDNTIDELERCVDNLNKLLLESHPNLEKGFTSEEYKLFFQLLNLSDNYLRVGLSRQNQTPTYLIVAKEEDYKEYRKAIRLINAFYSKNKYEVHVLYATSEMVSNEDLHSPVLFLSCDIFH